MTASSLLAALVVVTCAALLPFSAAQSKNCSGRCGDPFARGQPCQCDASCLTHDECCKDFEALCTFGESCSGRCGESFRRGRLCECDPGCVRYDTCCRDYQNHCVSYTMTTLNIVHNLNGFSRHGRALFTLDADSNPDLCSDLPLNGLTTLANGTILIFKGHFFWTIDPITKDHGPAHNIREELGIPSPIDSNCRGKNLEPGKSSGDDYWRMDNGNMEPGYPKSVASGFHGLTGTITAALPVPATRRRPESVYFFKKGGTMQKYSYHAGSSTVCGKKSKPSAKKRHARQTEMSLGAEINIKLALKGFPSSVTSAVSVPSPKKADGYDYFLFAGPLYFNIKISGDLPALAKPDNADPRQNSIKKWLKCI
uniref:Proteoglycan 4a n=1 Tax=Oncorhynchus mykiss TaxID=8022 RepID=A0A8K9UBB9_ONCMY